MPDISKIILQSFIHLFNYLLIPLQKKRTGTNKPSSDTCFARFEDFLKLITPQNLKYKIVWISRLVGIRYAYLFSIVATSASSYDSESEGRNEPKPRNKVKYFLNLLYIQRETKKIWLDLVNAANSSIQFKSKFVFK